MLCTVPNHTWTIEAYQRLSQRYAMLKNVMRYVSVVLGLAMAWNITNPGVWILFYPNAVITKVASLSSSASVFGYMWVFLGSCLIPYILCNILGVTRKAALEPCTRLACLATAGGAILWGFLAWLSRDLDYGTLVYLFGTNAALDLLVSLVLAVSVNEHQKLTAEEAK